MGPLEERISQSDMRNGGRGRYAAEFATMIGATADPYQQRFDCTNCR